MQPIHGSTHPGRGWRGRSTPLMQVSVPPKVEEMYTELAGNPRDLGTMNDELLNGWGRTAFRNGVYNLQISSTAQIALRPICASDLHWIFLYYSQWALHSSTENKTKFSLQRKISRRWRVWGSGGGLIGRRKLILHKYLLFPAALASLSVGIRELVQMCLGAALAITGIVMPTAFIGLWRSAMTLVFLEGVKKEKKKKKECFIRFIIGLSLFLLKIRTKLSWFCPCCTNLFDCVCPLHFYI